MVFPSKKPKFRTNPNNNFINERNRKNNQRYQHIDWQREKVALGTVVKVEGSAYRRMVHECLSATNGQWVGGISGGCLEGDALKRAQMAIMKNSSSIVVYDTTEDDPHQIGVGLGLQWAD